MTALSKHTVECPRCAQGVQGTDEFCPACGELLVDGISCANHPDALSRGACIICCVAYCSRCGHRVQKLFLCNDHATYEIYQGLARVYGTTDEAQAHYAFSCLEQQNIHAFLYVRKGSPISMGAPEYTLFHASGDPSSRTINEVKLMVPVQEVLLAETFLREIHLLG